MQNAALMVGNGTSAQNIVAFIVADVDLVTYFAATVIPDAMSCGRNTGT